MFFSGSHCSQLIALLTLSDLNPVRVKGGKSLRNGMWHGVRNGIIMRNTIYAGNKLTEERILFSRQFYKSIDFSMLRTVKQPNSRSRIRKYTPGIEHV